MAAARQAIGGENRLAAVKTLQVTGTFRRVVANSDVDGDFDIFVELPDTYLRSEKTGTPGQPSTETVEALVGGATRDAVRGGGGGRGGRGGADAAGTADGVAGGADDRPQPPDDDRPEPGQAPNESANAEPGRGAGGRADADIDAPRRARQAEVGRLLLMWLLRTDMPAAWIGIAKSPDGQADVINVPFAGESTRLFLDSASHMPLMMVWQGTPARAGGPGRRRGGAPPEDAPPGPMAFEMTFADHRVVNGIKLPHLITRGLNGQTIERWAIRSYRVNPSFDAKTFTR